MTNEQLECIPRMMKRDDSLIAQLRDLVCVAHILGMWKASDHLNKYIYKRVREQYRIIE